MVRLDDDLARLARRYENFAMRQAEPTSPSYKELCLHVAQSGTLLRFIAGLPIERQQPNLFLAAVRTVGGVPNGVDALDEVIGQHGGMVREVMLTRTTQTNEPARCAVFLPVLANLPQPLALLEVGAAAGLCLLPDKYAYDYEGIKICPSKPGPVSAPVFPCGVNQATPVPRHNVDVVWRAGLDLNPLDIRCAKDTAWLRTFVWPEHRDRADRLEAAFNVARADPPRLIAGDLLTDLVSVAATAPKGATLVIFHTAVLNYVAAPAERKKFAAVVRELDAVWISNEAPGVFPEAAIQAPPQPSPGLFFLQSINGEPVAWTGPHGQSIHWFA
jgi:hypothetical protein